METLNKILYWTAEIINEIWPIAFATFIGAWIAFQLQKHHERKKERLSNIAAGKSAQFAIVTQLNSLKNIHKQYLSPLERDTDRALKLTPFSVHAEFPQLNLESLQFMLEGEGAQLLNELMISEHRFVTLLGSLEQRNIRHEQMQRRLAVEGDAALDAATVQILKDMTDSIYGLTDDAIKSHTQGVNKLKEYLEKRFSGSKGLSVEFIY